jgi:transcriptional regulator with XRE-family HTH domain
MSNAELFEQIKGSRALLTGGRRAAVAFMFRALMVERKLKNVDIALRLGVSEANVSRWLRGDQNLSLDTLHALSDALGVTLAIQARPVCEAKASKDDTEWTPAPAQMNTVVDFCAYRDLRQAARRGKGSSFAKPVSEIGQDPQKDGNEQSVAVG